MGGIGSHWSLSLQWLMHAESSVTACLVVEAGRWVNKSCFLLSSWTCCRGMGLSCCGRVSACLSFFLCIFFLVFVIAPSSELQLSWLSAPFTCFDFYLFISISCPCSSIIPFLDNRSCVLYLFGSPVSSTWYLVCGFGWWSGPLILVTCCWIWGR